MKGLLATAAVAALLSACTPLQIATFERLTGADVDEPATDSLVALPDVPMRLADGQVIHPDGSVHTPTTTGRCAEWFAMALAAGFTHEQWVRLAPIMYRESRCQPTAYNRSGASGLLQIMPMWAPHCGVTRSQLFDASTNLRCGVHILRVQGWQAWAL